MIEKKYELRSEAGVLGAGELTREQEQAGDQLFGLIEEMVKSPDQVDAPKPSYLPRIDKKRSNRVLLIDGGRGSGKTALLLTLIEQWRLEHRDPPPAEEESKDGDDKKAPRCWRGDGRIVPVGPGERTMGLQRLKAALPTPRRGRPSRRRAPD